MTKQVIKPPVTKPPATVPKKKNKKPNKTSLKAMRRQLASLAPVWKSPRARRPAVRNGPEVEQMLAELDEEIGVLDPGMEVEDEDDTDYLQSIPGRPGQFRITWAEAYGKRNTFGKGFAIECEEPHCVHSSRTILLDSKLVEISAGSTPHGKPRKPPVCHKVPWAALEKTMLDMESAESIRANTLRKLTDNFRKRVCWFPSNLSPGHNACNAAGTKTTAQTVSVSETKKAKDIIQQVINEFKSVGVWQ